jgi:hypothetical protein
MIIRPYPCGIAEKIEKTDGGFREIGQFARAVCNLYFVICNFLHMGLFFTFLGLFLLLTGHNPGYNLTGSFEIINDR